MSDDRGRPVLALNAGSSSFKFGFFMVGTNGHRVLLSGAKKTLADSQSAMVRNGTDCRARPARAGRGRPSRIVQGGPQCRHHALIGAAVIQQLGSDLPPRLVITHLGHGASVTAVAHGASVDTSMGLTSTGGVIMSTRCGDLDPGVLA